MKLKRKEGFFSISAVAKMFSVHQQTIRLYEKQGLIAPHRSSGNTRLFSEDDIDKLEEIIHLTHNLGINLAGVGMILKLKKQIKKMQKDMNQVFQETQQQLDRETESAHASIATNVKRLMAIKKEQVPITSATGSELEPVKQDKRSKIVNALESLSQDQWKIDYED